MMLMLFVLHSQKLFQEEAPRRGNGLKVVRRVAESNMVGLLLRSGLGVVRIPKILVL